MGKGIHEERMAMIQCISRVALPPHVESLISRRNLRPARMPTISGLASSAAARPQVGSRLTSSESCSSSSRQNRRQPPAKTHTSGRGPSTSASRAASLLARGKGYSHFLPTQEMLTPQTSRSSPLRRIRAPLLRQVAVKHNRIHAAARLDDAVHPIIIREVGHSCSDERSSDASPTSRYTQMHITHLCCVRHGCDLPQSRCLSHR